MLTKEQALKLLAEKLHEMDPPGDRLVCCNELTIEKPYGWIFFYDSEKYIETREDKYLIAGNGPAVINKHTGTIEFLATYKAPEKLIEEYEARMSRP